MVYFFIRKLFQSIRLYINAEIKNHFHSEKKKEVRRRILPGNSKSLWNAVKVSKNIGTCSLPKAMTVNGVKVDVHERSNHFATNIYPPYMSVVIQTLRFSFLF